MAVLHLHGTGASPGVCLGRAYIYRAPQPSQLNGGHAGRRDTLPAGDRTAEIERLRQARAQAADELHRLSREVGERIGPTEGAVFEAQALFLDDPALVEPMENAIRDRGCNASQAAHEAIEHAAAELQALNDPYLQARAADLRDVGERLARLLEAPSTGQPAASSGSTLDRLAPGTVLIADDLTPSDTIGLDHRIVAGVVLAGGTPLAHAAILARGLGLPLVVAAGDSVWQIKTGQPVMLDGKDGTILVEPDVRESAAYQTTLAVRGSAARSPIDTPPPPVHTADGRRIELMANVSSPAEAAMAASGSAEGIGLIRTEFLLAALAASTSAGGPPSEDALAAAYGGIFETMAGRPVIVRAMDVGGDKPLPFLYMSETAGGFQAEANPFLGWRGIRVLLDEQELFAGQIRAALRAAAEHQTDLRLMFPMVSTVTEFVQARRLVETVRVEAGIELAHPLRIGVMIEVPAAALIADALAREADFFSLGTNDLTQYVMAADRGNPRVRPLCRLTDPAVLRLIDMTVRAAHAADRPVGVCGEAAGSMPDLLLLVGLGVDELSVGAARLPDVRNILGTIAYEQARALAIQALSAATAEDVAALLKAQDC